MESQRLSGREIEVLKLIAQGKSNKEIAVELIISTNTVAVHIRNIYKKISGSTRTEATIYAIEHGIIESPTKSNQFSETSDKIVPPNQRQVISQRISVPFQEYWWIIPLVILVFVFFLSSRLTKTPIMSLPTPTINPVIASLSQKRWQNLADLPHPRAGAALVAYDSGIYVVAGESENGPTNLLERYDLRNNSWIRLPDKPTAVKDVSAVLIGNKIFIPGGELSDGQQTNILETYDVYKNSWEERAKVPQSVSAYTLASFEGEMYLFGGRNGENVLDNVFIYNPQTDKWRKVGSMLTPRSNARATVIESTIYISGGWDGKSETNLHTSYIPSLETTDGNSWSQEDSLPYRCTDCYINNVAASIFYITEQEVWQFNTLLNPRKWVLVDSVEKGFILGESSTISTNDGFVYFLGGKKRDLLASSTVRYQALFIISIPSIMR